MLGRERECPVGKLAESIPFCEIEGLNVNGFKRPGSGGHLTLFNHHIPTSTSLDNRYFPKRKVAEHLALTSGEKLWGRLEVEIAWPT